MPEPKKLRMGVDCPSPTMHEQESRVAVLQSTVQHYLPEFDAAIKKIVATGDNAVLMLHQDAFAAGYDDDEYTLLGMAIKYAGLHGVTITIIGKDEETLR
jgi:hypothetical protein